jgi:hypothetical protein
VVVTWQLGGRRGGGRGRRGGGVHPVHEALRGAQAPARPVYLSSLTASASSIACCNRRMPEFLVLDPHK